jgi:phosphatidylserine/phosphatidylglycerophosphate/cardiolipin synthase-like enzyme
LRGVRCKGVKKGFGSDGRTVIRVAQWGWTAPRADIARRLSQLQGQGCKVEVLINKARTSKKVFAPLLRNTRYGKVKIYDGWYDANNNGVASQYIHHKVLAISGRVLGSSGTKVVYTGSQNYTEEGNRVNDEMVLRIWDRSTYNTYVRHLNYVRAHGTKGRITQVPRYIGNRAPVISPNGELEHVPGRGGIEAGEERAETPMIDDDGFQRPAGGDVDFDG